MPKTIVQCKVCMSKHRTIIEELARKQLSAEKIYEHLQSLTTTRDVKIVKTENIKPSSIRRHLQRHFNDQDELLTRDATIKTQTRTDRQDFDAGKKILIDKVNTIAYMIKLALTRLDEVDQLSDSKKQQYTVAYMGQVKGLVDELSKISGSIKEEGTIDANFFKTEINTFAEIVLMTIRVLDQQYSMNYELETAFTTEFKRQWELYQKRQDLIFEGKLSPTDGERERNINKYNDSKNLV